MSIFLPKIPIISRPTLIFFYLLLSFFVAFGTPPDDPIKCSSNNSNCTITNSYGAFPDRTICRAADVVYPTTEQELVNVVADGTKNRRKMKVATRYSHSIPKLVCPDGEDGLLISTKSLNKILNIDSKANTMTVQSGVTLEQVISEAAKAGLALPYGPYWWGLTIGGLLGTGAHGSSLWGKGSAVHEYVTELRIVSPGGREDGFVKVRILDESNEQLNNQVSFPPTISALKDMCLEWDSISSPTASYPVSLSLMQPYQNKTINDEFNAAKVSLGVLGVISEVTLKLEPQFKRNITYKPMEDSDLGDQAETFGNKHEFADFTWYPSQRKVLYRIDDRVSNNISGNGLYDFIGFRAYGRFSQRLLEQQEDMEKLNNAEGKCITSKLITLYLEHRAFGLTNDGDSFTRYPVTGSQNSLQASGGCLNSLNDSLETSCPWDPRIEGQYFQQTTFTIALSKVKAFIEDVQRLVALEPKSMCGTEIYNGILMRYVKASTAYLGKEDDALDFDITYYRSKDPLTPRLYEDILEEIEQMAMFKYDGLPHWGKNRNLAFDGAIKKYKKGEEFLKVKEKYDPLGLFSSEWTDQVLGLKEGLTIIKDGCALEGLCICSKDNHCAPDKGYLCSPGRIYKEARVCKRVSN